VSDPAVLRPFSPLRIKDPLRDVSEDSYFLAVALLHLELRFVLVTSAERELKDGCSLPRLRAVRDFGTYVISHQVRRNELSPLSAYTHQLGKWMKDEPHEEGVDRSYEVRGGGSSAKSFGYDFMRDVRERESGDARPCGGPAFKLMSECLYKYPRLAASWSGPYDG
jgi:hypothetical protein